MHACCMSTEQEPHPEPHHKRHQRTHQELHQQTPYRTPPLLSPPRAHLRATHAALSSVVPLKRTAGSNSNSTNCLTTRFRWLEQYEATIRTACRQAVSYCAHQHAKMHMLPIAQLHVAWAYIKHRSNTQHACSCCACPSWESSWSLGCPCISHSTLCYIRVPGLTSCCVAQWRVEQVIIRLDFVLAPLAHAHADLRNSSKRDKAS
jgi:hypothetical protein